MAEFLSTYLIALRVVSAVGIRCLALEMENFVRTYGNRVRPIIEHSVIVLWHVVFEIS